MGRVVDMGLMGGRMAGWLGRWIGVSLMHELIGVWVSGLCGVDRRVS